ncbi:epithelial-stromal interaction protein 1 isoform X1 [Acanthopagrus latus]|uniref:epithelial-stromal interaction protein 1 isoform X1 n=2 Tax=Acanthopagrus latus TaxID=8177 RepID=UPI00187C02DD|nr:epithelial-stromal interaction protein 1 isoform X1 [Acanthopagrus latus]
MDPYDNQRDQLNPRRAPAHLTERAAGEADTDPTAENAPGHAPDGRDPRATDRQPRYSDGFTMIAPNESRRSKMQMVSQKELEDLQRWKEANRAPPVHLNPERLGGSVTLDEARQKQFRDLRCSKLQKKLKKEEQDRRKRQEEEEELQKMKNEKREMAERLEEKRRQEEQRRREKLQQDHLRNTERFLHRFETRAPGPVTSSGAAHTSSRSEAMVSKQREEAKSVKDVQLEHKRVNSAFLDKLEGRDVGSEKEPKSEVMQEVEYPCSTSDFRYQPPNTSGQQHPLNYTLDTNPDQSCSGWKEEADTDPDYDWSLMKLMNSFPNCSREFLEDILDQCNNDYEQAFSLLINTLS